MNFRFVPFRVISILQGLFLLLLLPVASPATETVLCIKCHKEYVDRELRKSHIHQPFRENKCAFCHLPDWVDYAADSDGQSIFPHKTKLLGHDENLSLSHLFALSKEQVPAILFIEAKNPAAKQPFRVKLKVPPLETLKILEAGADMPEISNIRVVEVTRSGQVSARIGFQTNKPTYTQISYGTGDQGTVTTTCPQYENEHVIELKGLQADATYHFKIQAEDLYGNSTESPVASFSTEKEFHPKQAPANEEYPGPIQLNSEIFKSESNLLMRISANQPVSLEISTFDLPAFSLLRENTGNLPENHPQLKNVYETNMVVCESCHEALSKKFSHPVHFRAKLGSNIPSDYPRLPNGQISCLTCHEYHASDYQYHLRKRAERELCIGCHKRSFRN